MFNRILEFLENNYLSFNFQIVFSFGLANNKEDQAYDVVEAVSPSIGFHNFITPAADNQEEEDDDQE